MMVHILEDSKRHRWHRPVLALHSLQPIIAETKREEFAGRDMWVPSKSLPRTANLSREKSGPSERFLGSGRNLKSLPAIIGC